MNTMEPCEDLAEIFDQVVREITQKEAGIELQSSDAELDGEFCTVYTTFHRGYHTSLSLCAERSMFVRLTRRMMEREDVSDEDVEVFAKEYFYMLCGHVATRLYEITKVPARFGIPVFCRGRYALEDRMEHIVLTYSSDEQECARLVHHALEELAHQEQKEGLPS